MKELRKDKEKSLIILFQGNCKLSSKLERHSLVTLYDSFAWHFVDVLLGFSALKFDSLLVFVKLDLFL